MPEQAVRSARIRERDPATLGAVVHECLPVLLRAARAAGLDPDSAEDAVQETFVVFFRAYDPPSSVGGGSGIDEP